MRSDVQDVPIRDGVALKGSTVHLDEWVAPDVTDDRGLLRAGKAALGGRAVVVHSAPTSVTVLVNVETEEPLEGVHEETLRAFLTYAPLEAGRVPVLPCASEDDRLLFEGVEHRLNLQAKIEPFV